MNIMWALLIPIFGTVLGAGCVFFMKKQINTKIQKTLLGFAAGVMIAASVWSLIIPAIEMSSSMDKFAFIPAVVGLIIGIGFLFLLDRLIPHLHIDSKEPEGPKSHFKKTTMLVLAITLHNIPEGMAIGVTIAGVLTGSSAVTFAGALVLAIGIGIQNFPEGAIVSMPLMSEGMTRKKSFLYGIISGIVEPIASLLTILFATFVIPILPYMLAFAAGAMIYVVVEELIPEASAGEHSNLGTIGFSIGFIIMMVLDVALS